MHMATADEIDRAAEIATSLHARFNRLMDARVGVGKWADPTREQSPAPEEHALMVAESDVLGWLYIAKIGQHLREPLDKRLKRCAARIELWGLPVPEIIRTGPNSGINRSREAASAW